MIIDQTLLHPKETIIEGRKFLLSKLPATVAREVIIPFIEATDDAGNRKEGDIPIEVSLRLLSYVCAESGKGKDAQWVRLQSAGQVDSFAPDILVYIKLEREMYRYNTDFSETAKS